MTTGGPLAFAGLPAGWSSLNVKVELLSVDIEFTPREKEIEVLRNAPSAGVVFLGRLRSGLPLGHETEIVAIFQYENRFAGIARRTILVGGSMALPLREPPSQATAAPTFLSAPPPADDVGTALKAAPSGHNGVIGIEPNAEAPDMTVRIFHPDNTPEGSFLWSLTVKGMPPKCLPRKLHVL